MVIGFLEVINAVFKIRKYGLTGHIIFSLIISLIVLSFAVYCSYHVGIYLGHYLEKIYPFQFGKQALDAVSEIISVVFSILLTVILFRYIIQVLLSPILGFVSEKVEGRLKGQKVLGAPFLPAICRGAGISSILIFKELVFTILLLVLSLIPFINFFTPFLLLLVQSYYYGCGGFDFYYERRFSIGESINASKKNRLIVCGVGLGGILLLFIPIIGLILSPFAVCIAATELAVKRDI